MKSIIQSEKHMVQTPIASVVSGAIAVIDIVVVRQNPSGLTAGDLGPGATVKAVFCELWLLAEGTGVGSLTVSIEKLTAGQIDMTHAQSQALHTYPNKKNIFYTTQGLVGDQDVNPTPFLRMWIKIPKGKQRMGLGDKVVCNISANNTTVSFCGLFILKAYT